MHSACSLRRSSNHVIVFSSNSTHFKAIQILLMLCAFLAQTISLSYFCCWEDYLFKFCPSSMYWGLYPIELQIYKYVPWKCVGIHYVPFVEVLSSFRLYTCTQLITGQTCLGKVTIVRDWYTRIGKYHFVKSFILQNGCNDGLWTYSKCGSESDWLLQK